MKFLALVEPLVLLKRSEEDRATEEPVDAANLQVVFTALPDAQ